MCLGVIDKVWYEELDDYNNKDHSWNWAGAFVKVEFSVRYIKEAVGAIGILNAENVRDDYLLHLFYDCCRWVIGLLLSQPLTAILTAVRILEGAVFSIDYVCCIMVFCRCSRECTSMAELSVKEMFVYLGKVVSST